MIQSQENAPTDRWTAERTAGRTDGQTEELTSSAL